MCSSESSRANIRVNRSAQRRRLDEGHGAKTRPVGGLGTAGSQRRFDLGEENPQHRVDQIDVVMEEVPQPLRQRQHPLPDRHLGEYVIDEVRGGFGHAAGGARRADPPLMLCTA